MRFFGDIVFLFAHEYVFVKTVSGFTRANLWYVAIHSFSEIVCFSCVRYYVSTRAFEKVYNIFAAARDITVYRPWNSIWRGKRRALLNVKFA